MSLNKIMLIGNVGKDPDVRDVNGAKVATFTLATTERGYTKQDGTQVSDRTEWHNIVVWRGLAEVVEKYVRKGSKIYIDGKYRTRKYTDRNNVERYISEVYVDTLELLGNPQQAQQQAPQPAQQPYQQPAQQQYQPQPQQGYGPPSQSYVQQGFGQAHQPGVPYGDYEPAPF